MNPIAFEQCNKMFGPPPGMDESQCMRIPAYVGRVQGGPMDGADIVVVGWKPTPEELAGLNQGQPLYLTFLGGLAAHYPSVSLEQAMNPK